MNKKLTDVTVILDRSGSMEDIWSDAIGGFKEFVKKQKKEKGSMNFSLYAFDDQYDGIINARDIKEVNIEKAMKGVAPRGMTALLDAIGKTLNTTEERIKSTKEKDKPGKVLIAVITDGLENASREFDRKSVMKIINKRKKKDKWVFVFLAANQDAIAEGGSMGYSLGNAVNYKATKKGMKRMSHVFTSAVTSYRSASTKEAEIMADSLMVDSIGGNNIEEGEE
jgi:uncharacterized protein YegL